VSAHAHPRMPLVLAASREAQEQAQRFGVRGCLENVVTVAIGAGNVHGDPGVGRTANVYLDGAVVEVRRVRSRLSGRKAWVPIAVRPNRKEP
jgi:hypothetical protein